MPITRAKASSLLNQREMALYDDSRINGLRQLDARGLDARIRRARTARDRARDLVQKQRLASRAATGSKRGSSGQANQRSADKAELMADILQRFEGRLKDVEREAAPPKSAATRPARKASKTAKTAKTARTVPAKKATGKGTDRAGKPSKQATRTTSRQSAATGRAGPAGSATGSASASPGRKRAATAGRSGPRAATANKPAAATPARKRAGKSRKRRITPEQALAQTQALLEAKQAQDVAPKPWQDTHGGGNSVDGQPGYQSGAARRRALDLHAAEARIPAIQGSVSTRDRISQGKRDHRGDGNGD